MIAHVRFIYIVHLEMLTRIPKNRFNNKIFMSAWFGKIF